MRQIDVDDLPKWSPWPTKLLDGWTGPKRSPSAVAVEYDKVKYAACAKHFTYTQRTLNAEDIRDFELGGDPNRDICISEGRFLYESTARSAKWSMSAVVRNSVVDAAKGCATIVELGCGYGYNLSILRERLPGIALVGGDQSKTAVELAGTLLPGDSGTRVLEFDFMDRDSYSLLDDAKGPLAVFTCHAVEQLQTAGPLMDALVVRRGKIRSVVHLEPLPPADHDTMLDLLRRRYTKANGYNSDLLDLLREREDRKEINVVSLRRNVFGINPLNPTSVIRWEFR